MKTSIMLHRNNTGCLYKLCSGWSGAGGCISPGILKTQMKKLFSSCKLQHAHTLSGRLFPTTKCVSNYQAGCPSNVCSVMYSNKNLCLINTNMSDVHTWCRLAPLGSLWFGGLLKGSVDNNRQILSRDFSRLTKSDRKGDDNTDEDYDKLEHRKRMQRLSADNDMLSRFRNTYIMTLVCFASLQFELTQLSSTIAAVAIATSELNLSFGTVVYISNLIMLRRSDKISVIYFLGCIAFATIHFVLWSILLALTFPNVEVLDEELKRYTAEN